MSPFRKTVPDPVPGQVFGHLTVLSPELIDGRHTGKWACICACGGRVWIKKSNLTGGLSTSCGCRRKDTNSRRLKTHGHATCGAKTRTYRIWAGMVARCHIPSASKWEYYGGRGIAVCSRWRMFENFLRDMGECPDGLTIERIDNNVGYEPGNCKWATWDEQRQNKTKGTHCKYGHPFFFDASQGRNICKTCRSSARKRCREKYLRSQS